MIEWFRGCLEGLWLFWYLFSDRTWEESTLPKSQNTITCYCSPFSQQGMFILTLHVFWISTMQNCDVFNLASKLASSFRRIWILFDYTCHYKRSCGIFCIIGKMVGAPCDGGASQYLDITRDHQMNTQVFATGVAFFILHAQVEKLRWWNMLSPKSHIPGSLTQPLKIYHPKREVVFQLSLFRGYLKLRECIRFVFCI